MFCLPCRRLHPSSSACPITQDCRFPFSIPVQAANGGSTYSETWAFVFNALFYPLPSSCCLCWPDVLVCEAEVLCGLPRGEDSEVRIAEPLCGTQNVVGVQPDAATSTGSAAGLWCCLQQLLALGSAGKPLSFG